MAVRPPPRASGEPPAPPLVESFEAVTYSLGAAGFLGIALFQALAASFAASATATLGNGLGSAVCLVAGLHYQWMRPQTGRENVATRYSDWYLTTVLMLVEFFVLANALRDRWPWLVGASLACELMLLGGHVATLGSGRARSVAFGAGMVAGVVLAVCFVAGTAGDHDNQWMYAFAAVWLLYPAAFWAGRYQAVCYNLLDVYSKGVFGLTLGLVTFLRE